MDIRYHLDALLLSIASSTDNFTVGVSTGVVVNRHRHDHQHRGSNITKDDLPIWVNASISVSNALGALAAGFVGASVRSSQQIILLPSSSASASAAAATLAPPMLAAVAFGYLAIQELVSYLQAKRKEASHRESAISISNLPVKEQGELLMLRSAFEEQAKELAILLINWNEEFKQLPIQTSNPGSFNVA